MFTFISTSYSFGLKNKSDKKDQLKITEAQKNKLQSNVKKY